MVPDKRRKQMGRERKQLHKRKTKWACSACLVLVSTLCTTQFARAATWTGNGDGTSWNDAYNWDGYPSDGSDVMLGPYNANVIYDQNSTTKNISNLTLDWIFGQTEEYINTFQIVQNSGTLTISHIYDTFGDLNVEDGTLTINNGDMYEHISTASTYTLNGGTLIKSGYEVKIGTTGEGLFVQNGGEFQFSGAMYLGDQVWSHGSYVMSNGSLVAGPNGLGSIVLGEWGGDRLFFSFRRSC
jgi:hypothetical protein